jgi:hypothetical protein
LTSVAVVAAVVVGDDGVWAVVAVAVCWGVFGVCWDDGRASVVCCSGGWPIEASCQFVAAVVVVGVAAVVVGPSESEHWVVPVEAERSNE